MWSGRHYPSLLEGWLLLPTLASCGLCGAVGDVAASVMNLRFPA